MSRLLHAVFENDVSKIGTLLERDPRLIGDQDAFCQAIGWGHKDAAMFLMDRGADLDAKDRNGNTPLQMASMAEDSALFHELVRRGSKLQDLSSVASNAAMSGHLDILRFLQDAGVNLNEGESKKRPLEAAIGTGDIATVRYLLNLGVDTSDIDTSRPIQPWKGCMATSATMEEIRHLIENSKTAKTVGQPATGPSRDAPREYKP
ncbi:MAG: ankyrin repeat domain-containing protein [Verrucomicrobiaceae bacterium]|nr:ankyrin repeat domain-containing protein [Verrucomicrobiaceae bacterium]